ncbi:MAG: Spy/CpxP family protein refolding chaperone [Rhodopseudomonas sp.]|uniref:Spy/CpxP family protein refolding chaperone n=1 Tax=Rhodopseudomonas sp. TaxID=1078 RepID=UPI00184B6774|nr:Spy/CpxP family protein refolding chaperone [Rhodopseudomonas sp.]NVN86858.1 Spy/CpxP family protein refolding chaperone [Rhodopseudomonas sp.]
MKKVILASVAVLVLAGSTAVYAQHRPWWFNHGMSRMNPEDRVAFADARIAAVKAGLKLTPDQDKLWPPVEAAVRDFAKLRIESANARMKAWRDDDDSGKPVDPVAKLRERADTMANSSAALKKIADAAEPLYKTLDDGQKRRLAALTHMDGRFGGRHWRGHGMMYRGDDRGDDGDRGRGPGRGMMGRGPGMMDGGPGPDRL